MLRTISLLAALLAACALSLGAGEAVAASPALARVRALESYALMQRYFYVPATRSFNGTYPPVGRRHAQVWPYSQALSATLELAQLPGGGAAARGVLPRMISTLAAYRAPLGPRSRRRGPGRPARWFARKHVSGGAPPASLSCRSCRTAAPKTVHKRVAITDSFRLRHSYDRRG